MEKTIFLFSFLILGIIGRYSGYVPNGYAKKLNKLLINFFIPVLTLRYLPEMQFSEKHIWLVLSPWIVYLGSMLFFEAVNVAKPIPRKTRAVLIMTSGIGSISFAGFPIFEMLYGQEGLAMGIILSLAGTFVVCNTLGVFTGFWFAQKQTNFLKLLKNIFTFPPFIAMLLSFVLLAFNYKHTEIISDVLTVMGKPFSYLALFTIGLGIKKDAIKKNKNYFLLGQCYKLVLAPSLIFIILYLIGEHESTLARICVLGAGLGSMNTIAIVAAELKLKPDLAFLMPGLGIPISMITVLLIYILFF
ncbi:AEC family transporter [Croceitalea marina]|uniref:AEC family transporter n=1 Tax=Croceitalea marina TaxID=1775166 RepID=A0ABW5MZV5_9FLAO